jgi:hypothetical protein
MHEDSQIGWRNLAEGAIAGQAQDYLSAVNLQRGGRPIQLSKPELMRRGTARSTFGRTKRRESSDGGSRKKIKVIVHA